MVVKYVNLANITAEFTMIFTFNSKLFNNATCVHITEPCVKPPKRLRPEPFFIQHSKLKVFSHLMP